MSNLDPIPKLLILSGVGLLLAGILWQFGIFDMLKLGRLPGDIVMERPHAKIYIPIVTSLLISLLLSLISYLMRR